MKLFVLANNDRMLFLVNEEDAKTLSKCIWCKSPLVIDEYAEFALMEGEGKGKTIEVVHSSCFVKNSISVN